MGAGDARHPFHRQRIQIDCSIAVDVIAACQRVQPADQQCSCLRPSQRLRVRGLDAQQDVGFADNRLAVAKACAGCLEIAIGDRGLLAGPALDRNGGPKRDEFLDCFGDCGAARFARCRFLENGNLGRHGALRK